MMPYTGYYGDGAPDRAAVLESMLAQVEASRRALEGELDRLEEYYSALEERLAEVQEADDGNTGEDEE
jgi:vacuolar-type H+-ATPase subunit E/Vma4